MILLSLGIAVGLVVSTIVAFTLDRGRQRGPAFSLAHHFPETIGFFILGIGLGIGSNIDNVKIKRLIRVASTVVLLFYTLFAIVQIKGFRLPIGVPLFIPLVIAAGLICGYVVDRYFYGEDFRKMNIQEAQIVAILYRVHLKQNH